MHSAPAEPAVEPESTGVIDLILGATVAEEDQQVYHRIKWLDWVGDWWQRSPTVPDVLRDNELYLNRAIWIGHAGSLPKRCVTSLEPHAALGAEIEPGVRWAYTACGNGSGRMDLALSRCDGKLVDWSLLSPSRTVFTDRVVDFTAPVLAQALEAWERERGKVYPTVAASRAIVAAAPADTFDGEPKATTVRIAQLLAEGSLSAPEKDELRLLCRSLAKHFLPGGLIHDSLCVLGD
jgi:hypothetical protein